MVDPQFAVPPAFPVSTDFAGHGTLATQFAWLAHLIGQSSLGEVINEPREFSSVSCWDLLATYHSQSSEFDNKNLVCGRVPLSYQSILPTNFRPNPDDAPCTCVKKVLATS